jgi:hypothetical protein
VEIILYSCRLPHILVDALSELGLAFGFGHPSVFLRYLENLLLSGHFCLPCTIAVVHVSLLDSHNLKLLPLLVLPGLLDLDLVQKFGLLRELLSEQSFL